MSLIISQTAFIFVLFSVLRGLRHRQAGGEGRGCTIPGQVFKKKGEQTTNASGDLGDGLTVLSPVP